jgi:hypothetical protein
MIPRLKFNKGQAALTDSLFFLLIVVSVCVLLFRYSSTYGVKIQDSLNDFYFKEYANSAIRTLFYMTVPNDINISYNYPETDYLMTTVKQDYYNNARIGPTDSDINQLELNYNYISKYQLYNSLKVIMQPIENYDFLFYIFSGSSTDGKLFPFFLLKRTIFEKGEQEYSYDPINYTVDESIYYLCDPSNDLQVRNTFAKVGKIYSSSIPIRLQARTADIDATSLFALWPANVVIDDDVIENLNCKEIEDS